MSDEEMESSEQEGGGDETAMRQQWMTERQQAILEARMGKQKKNSDGVSDAMKAIERTAQKGYRIFNGVTGILSIPTLGWTLLLTCLSMNFQLICGNGLKISFFGRRVPPLTFPEILILAMVDLLVGIIFLAAFTLLVFIASCAGWTGTVQCAWEFGWDAVKALW